MTAPEKTDAIVLRVTEFSETSLVVTLYTRELGRISALAKGARRPKGPFESALDLLSVCRILCLHKNTDTLDLLTEAKLQRRFRSSERDLNRLYAGYYIAELILALTQDAVPSCELYELSDETLSAIDRGEDIAPLILRFELVLLRLLGHLPALTQCVECSTKLEDQSRIAFGLTTGGVLCAKCRKGKRNIVSVSANVMKHIRIFAEPDSEQWRTADQSLSDNGELRKLVNQYFTNHIGRRLKMSDYLKILGKRD